MGRGKNVYVIFPAANTIANVFIESFIIDTSHYIPSNYFGRTDHKPKPKTYILTITESEESLINPTQQ